MNMLTKLFSGLVMALSLSSICTAKRKLDRITIKKSETDNKFSCLIQKQHKQKKGWSDWETIRKLGINDQSVVIKFRPSKRRQYRIYDESRKYVISKYYGKTMKKKEIWLINSKEGSLKDS